MVELPTRVLFSDIRRFAFLKINVAMVMVANLLRSGAKSKCEGIVM